MRSLSIYVLGTTGRNVTTHSTQSILQFDDSHTLDVHSTRLYPFDAYLLTTTLFVFGSNGSEERSKIPFLGTVMLQHGTAFAYSCANSPIETLYENDWYSGQLLELRMRRQMAAKCYAIIMFAINWALCHFACGFAATAIWAPSTVQTWRINDLACRIRLLFASMVILYIIPQIRSCMPDAPGFDGVYPLYDLCRRHAELVRVGTLIGKSR